MEFATYAAGDGDYVVTHMLIDKKGMINRQPQGDLDRLTKVYIGVDIVFSQGP